MPASALRFQIDKLPRSADYQVELSVDGVAVAAAVIPNADLNRAPDAQAAMLTRPEEEDVAGIGRYLHSLLVRGDIEAAMPAGPPASIEIRAEPDLLRVLPWETLHDGRVFLSGTGIAMRAWRGVPGHPADSHPGEHLPLRLLVVVGDRDGGSSGWEEETQMMRRLFRTHAYRVDWELMIRPTAEKLGELCRKFRPHVFHFIGHGHMTPGQKQFEPVLDIWNVELQDDVPVTVTDLEELLVSRDWRVRMAVFNACRTGQATSQQAAYDFGRSFIRRLDGCCAITMQGDIGVEAASRFSRELYLGLVNEKTVDTAVAEARRSLRAAFPRQPDWVFPVLHVGCDPTVAVPMSFPAETDVLTIADTFDPLRDFVDRQPERRQLWSEVAYGEAPRRNLLVVYGEPGSGKTWVVEWVIRNWALRGQRVRYVRLDQHSHDFDTALEAIRDGSGADWGDNKAYPQALFAPFTKAVAEMRQDRARVDMYVVDIFNKFCTALGDVATPEKPLLLVLDSFGVTPPDKTGGVIEGGFAYLVKHFVKRVMDGLPNVRLLVATSAADMAEGKPLRKLKEFASTRSVGRLPYDQFVDLARERFADMLQPDWLPVFDALLARQHAQLDQQAGWTMAELDTLSNLMAKWDRRMDPDA